MKVAKKLKDYIYKKTKYYNDFLEKNKDLDEKIKNRMLKKLEKFYLEDKKVFLEIFWKSFYD